MLEVSFLRRISVVFFLLLLTLLVGCDRLEPLFFPTLTSFPTPTLKPSKTPTVTQTFTPTATFTPTTIPVARMGTPFPVEPKIIDAHSMFRMEKIAEWGQGVLQQVDWSPDGRVLAMATTHGILFYDGETLRQVRAIETESIQRSIKFSPDGKQIASGGDDGTICLWNAETGALEQTLKGQRFAVLSLAFSSDGSRLASSTWENTLWVWQVSSGVVVRKFEGMRSPALQISFSADNERLLAWSPLDQLKVWRLSDGKALQDFYIGLDRYKGSGTSAHFSADGSAFVVDQDFNVRIFNTANGTTRNLLGPFYTAVEKVLLSSDGALAAVVNAAEIQIWNTSNRSLVKQIALTGPATSISFSADGRCLFGVMEGLNIWCLLDTEEAQTMRLPADFSLGYTFSTHFDHSNTFFAALLDGKVLNQTFATGQIAEASAAPQNSGLFSAAVSIDGSLAAGGLGNRSIILWQPGSDSPLHTLKGHTQIVSTLDFSPEGDWLASAGGDQMVRVWQVSDGASLAVLEMPAAVSKVQFSADGAYLAASSLAGIKVWNTQNWQEEGVFRGYTFAFAPAGHALVSAFYQYSEQTVEIRLLGENKDAVEIAARGSSLALSPDASLLAAAGREITLWRVSDGAQLASLPVSSPYGDVMFSPDGRLLAYSGWDGSLTIWTSAP